ncbi:MAG: hypothetical protein ACK5M3_12300 [Dysgonomonas sp.]
MRSIVYLLTFVFFGCSSTKHPQPKNINISIETNLEEKQFINFFQSIEKKGKLKSINKYRLAILDRIVSFDSDTIIYYEHNLAPDMIIGQIDYQGNLYESENNHYQSYTHTIIEPDVSITTINNPLSSGSIIKLDVEATSVSGSFKNIVRTIKKEGWEQGVKKRKPPMLTGVRDYGNTFVVAIKIGGIYHFKSYNDISFEPNSRIEVESLEVISDDNK